MYLRTSFLTVFISVLPTATATPLPRRATSALNTYLTTCTTRSLTSDTTTSLLVLYSGLPTSTNAPLSLGTLTPSPALTWAGFTRRVTLDDGSGAVFESGVVEGAETWAKSEIVGTGRLNRGDEKEEFVCFRDGESVFRFGAGLVGGSGVGETTVCRAEFWCAGLGV